MYRDRIYMIRALEILKQKNIYDVFVWSIISSKRLYTTCFKGAQKKKKKILNVPEKKKTKFINISIRQLNKITQSVSVLGLMYIVQVCFTLLSLPKK